MEIRTVGA